MAIPTTTVEWIVEGPSKSAPLLRVKDSVPLAPLKPDEVLFETKVVGLNYRDLAIMKGHYPLPVNYPIVPCNDTAGVILAIGSAVTSLSVGDRVCVLASPLHVSGPLTTATHASLGDGRMTGALRKHNVLPASWLAPFPQHLSFIEACTLAGAGVTAWNSLFGGVRPVSAGDWVLTQGTGGLAMFAAAFAAKAGAIVVGTTSSAEKAQVLKDVGVTHVLNYREDSAWGESARALHPTGEGVDMVVDVGGVDTLEQSLKAIRYDGTVCLTGFLTSSTSGPSIMELLPRASTVRGVLIGSRVQFEEMVKAIEEWGFHPWVDKRVFGFYDAKEAFDYLWAKKHIGKVVIDVSIDHQKPI